jgi:hypothetical protein
MSPTAGARAGLGRRLDRNTGPARRPAIRRGSSRALPEPKNSRSTSPPFERVRARLAGIVEVLDVEAQDLVGAGGGLVEQPPEGAFAQVDVAALPAQLEARERDAAGVVVLLGAALQIDVAVDLEDPGARAVVRERSDGRAVAVPRRRARPRRRAFGGTSRAS